MTPSIEQLSEAIARFMEPEPKEPADDAWYQYATGDLHDPPDSPKRFWRYFPNSERQFAWRPRLITGC